ncbi:uncharacterized protein LOC129601350 [Paramacrobiotus metropolitanus]|uniref:uncharacterized protein LOC129601350 n=1 Tax=Paramacrobiotus metropolitanus TaxID=2943436 RepID=UPI0024459383|nr:uncharacterized protein LOC129601350 [Paramacrobiotus metropolitanus]
MRCGIATLALFMVSWNAVHAKYSWADQLKRVRKNPAFSIKKVGRSGNPGAKRNASSSARFFEAAESGYPLRHYSLYRPSYRPAYRPRYARYEYRPAYRPVTYNRPIYRYESPGCYGHPPGMYGNPGYNCRVFHICQADGRFDKMDCPASLKFNNYLQVCDWPNQVDSYCNPVYPNQNFYGNSYNYNYDSPRSYYYDAPRDHYDQDLYYAGAETKAVKTKAVKTKAKEKEKEPNGKKEKQKDNVKGDYSSEH